MSFPRSRGASVAAHTAPDTSGAWKGDRYGQGFDSHNRRVSFTDDALGVYRRQRHDDLTLAHLGQGFAQPERRGKGHHAQSRDLEDEDACIGLEKLPFIFQSRNLGDQRFI